MTSQISGVSNVYSTVYSGAYQRKHQSSASLAFVKGIHRWLLNFPHKGPVTRKCFHLMTSSCWKYNTSIELCTCNTLYWSIKHDGKFDEVRSLPQLCQCLLQTYHYFTCWACLKKHQNHLLFILSRLHKRTWTRKPLRRQEAVYST